MKHASRWVHHGFETQGKQHLKSEIEVLEAPQKEGLVSYKMFWKKRDKVLNITCLLYKYPKGNLEKKVP